MTAPTDLSHLRDLPDATLTRSEVRILCDEVDRLRDVLVDIAASVPAAHRNDGRDVPERIRDGAAAEAEVGRLRAENAALAAALEAIPRHRRGNDPCTYGACMVCAAPWPCPTENVRAALAALDADA